MGNGQATELKSTGKFQFERPGETGAAAEEIKNITDIINPDLNNTGAGAGGGQDNPGVDKPAPEADNKDNKGGGQPDTSFLKDIFTGDYADFVNLDRLKQIPTLLAERAKLTKDYSDLQARHQSLESPWANENVALLNSFVKQTGIDNFALFDKIRAFDPATADPVDVLVMQELINDPSFIGKEATIRAAINRDYPIDADNQKAEDNEINQFRLSKAAKAAATQITELKGKLRVEKPEDKSAQIAEARTKLKTDWTAALPKVFEKMEAIPLFSQGDKDEKPKQVFEYKLTPETKQALVQETLDVLVANDMPVTEESFAKAYNFAQNKMIMTQLPRMLSAYTTFMESEINKQKDKQFHNPSGLKENNDQAGGERTEGAYDNQRDVLRKAK